MTQKTGIFESHWNYLIHRPTPNTANDEHALQPLILFLHASGERGSDPELVKAYGLPRLIESQPDFPFIVVSPQCPIDTRWTDHVDVLDRFLTYILDLYPVDRERIYLSGMSMGGQGAWHFATLHPNRFAAVVPICGRIPPFEGYPDRVCVLRHVPLWVFHGAADDRVPVTTSEQLVSALRLGGGHPKLTIYPHVGHNAWDWAYAEPELFLWLMTQHKSTTPEES
jgi:predicted peptidase